MLFYLFLFLVQVNGDDHQKTLSPVGKNHTDLMQTILSDPKKFVENAVNLDPVAVEEIVSLLEALKATSEDNENYLIAQLAARTEEAVVTGNAVTDATNAVIAARGQLTDRESDLTDAEGAHEEKLAEKHMAQKEADDGIPVLNNEQDVITQVIEMLRGVKGPADFTRLLCNGLCNQAQARTLCESSGLALAAPNTRDEWTELLAAIPEQNKGYWIAGHDGGSNANEHVGASGSDTYSEGKFYPPHGQSELYIGCNVGEEGLVAARYSGSGPSTFDGCMGRGGSGAGELILMDERSHYSHKNIIGALCS